MKGKNNANMIVPDFLEAQCEIRYGGHIPIYIIEYLTYKNYYAVLKFIR
jgi:hypothetical protein